MCIVCPMFVYLYCYCLCLFVYHVCDCYAVYKQCYMVKFALFAAYRVHLFVCVFVYLSIIVVFAQWLLLLLSTCRHLLSSSWKVDDGSVLSPFSKLAT